MASANSSGLKRWYVIGAPYFWLFLFFLVPFFIVFKLSLSDSAIAIPPYTPTFNWSDGISGFLSKLDFENYKFIFSDPLYVNAYWSSLKIATVATLMTLLVAYPIAYGMARAPKAWQPTLMMLVILPFWTSFLIRIYAWIGILKKEGLLNLFLMHFGIISEPLSILNMTTAVYIGIVYSYLPFMILPLYASLEKISPTLLEAAEDLGSRPWKAFWQVTFPLSLPGVAAGGGRNAAQLAALGTAMRGSTQSTVEGVSPNPSGGSRSDLNPTVPAANQCVRLSRTKYSINFTNTCDFPVAVRYCFVNLSGASRLDASTGVLKDALCGARTAYPSATPSIMPGGTDSQVAPNNASPIHFVACPSSDIRAQSHIEWDGSALRGTCGGILSKDTVPNGPLKKAGAIR